MARQEFAHLFGSRPFVPVPLFPVPLFPLFSVAALAFGLIAFGPIATGEVVMAGVDLPASVVVLHRAETGTEIVVKEAATGLTLRVIPLDPAFYPIDVETMSHFGGSPADEIAVLVRDPAGPNNRVLVYDRGDGTLLAQRGFAAAFVPQDLEIAPDLDDSGREELVVLERNEVTGASRVQIKDPLTPGAISTATLEVGTIGLDLEVITTELPAGAELAILDIDGASGASGVAIHVAATGERTSSIDLPPAWTPLGLEVLDDFSGNGAPELAVLARRAFAASTRALVRDSATGDEVSRLSIPDGYAPRDLEIVPDFFATPADEVAIAATRTLDGRARVFVKEASTNATLAELQQAAAATPHDIAVVPDVAESPADEIATLGGGETPTVTVRDAKTGAKIKIFEIR